MVHKIHAHVSHSIVLGPLAKLQNSIICFVTLSVRTSFRMELFDLRLTDVNENWCWSIFRRYVEKIQVWL